MTTDRLAPRDPAEAVAIAHGLERGAPTAEPGGCVRPSTSSEQLAAGDLVARCRLLGGGHLRGGHVGGFGFLVCFLSASAFLIALLVPGLP